MFSIFKSKTTPLTSLFPTDFVDIHSHLLPGIDDGSQSLEESTELIKKMYSYGIKNFIITPHTMEGVWENTSEIILNKLKELQEHLIKIGLTDVKIRAASEYMLDNNFSKLLENKDLLTLKDNIILVEMSYRNPPLNLYEILFNIQVLGYQPILAHPERYLFLHNKYTEYQKMKGAGCLFQLNLLSLSGHYGKSVQETGMKLLKDNMINFVGSDTHNMRHLNNLNKIILSKKVIKLIEPILKNNATFQ